MHLKFNLICIKTYTMNSEDVKRFGIIIFESLPDEDIKTGYELFSSTLTNKTYEEELLHIEYLDLENKDIFLNELLRIANEAIDNNYFYFLHFEIHGFNGGLILKNGEEIFWHELLPIFQMMNIHYLDTLVIYLAVCEGASLLKEINPIERSPFGSIVASPHKIIEKDLAIGFEKFYDKFFFSFELKASLEEYNTVIKNEKSRLSLITSQYCINTLCNIERETADKETLFKILEDTFNKHDPNFKNLPESEVFEVLKKELYEIFEEFKLNKDFYLMNDLK